MAAADTESSTTASPCPGPEEMRLAAAAHEQAISARLNRTMDVTAYIVVATGYLTALFTARNLTLTGFLILTLGNLAWLIVFQRFGATLPATRTRHALTAAMCALTVVVASATWFGSGLDWLLPLVSVATIAMAYPLRTALMLTTGLWLTTIAIVLLLAVPSRLAGFTMNVASITPAFIFCFLFPLAVRDQQAQRQRAETLVTQVEEAQRQLRAYASEAEELAISRERNRMAREIHDTLGHYLTILSVQLETALKLEERGAPDLRQQLVEARRVTGECLAEVRRSVAALRPANLAALSLNDAMARLTEEFEALAPETGLTLDVESAQIELAPEIRLALYRSAQEALTNVRKHARATKVLVRLRLDARQADLTLLDDGVGGRLDAGESDGNTPGFGLLGMRERIALLGGVCESQAEPGKGWRVRVTIPLAAGARAAVEQPWTPTPLARAGAEG